MRGVGKYLFTQFPVRVRHVIIAGDGGFGNFETEDIAKQSEQSPVVCAVGTVLQRMVDILQCEAEGNIDRLGYMLLVFGIDNSGSQFVSEQGLAMFQSPFVSARQLAALVFHPAETFDLASQGIQCEGCQ